MENLYGKLTNIAEKGGLFINKIGIREYNESLVLNTIIRHQHVSRAEVSTLTKLNKASVSQIIKNLLSSQLVHEVGIGDASVNGGRRPIQLLFNRHCGVAISFDIGYNYIRSILSYIDGEIIYEKSKFHISVTRDTILSFIDEFYQSFLQQLPKTPHGLLGISIAIHGIVHENTIIYAPHYNLEHYDLKSILEAKYGIPVFIKNEANLAALGEYCASSQFTNLVSISVHSGIGAGIVTNGQLHTGIHSAAGEIGHITLHTNGDPCSCGNIGCLELYASNKALFETFSTLKNLPAIVTSEEFVQYYKKGDALAISLAEENARFLSIGIHNIAVFWDSEVIYVNSSVYQKLPELIQRINDTLKSRFSGSVLVKNSVLGAYAPLYGGIIDIARYFLNIEDLKIPSMQ